MENKPVICIVCYANFCRSPVAEAILNKRFGSKYQFISAGIDPKLDSNMDLRSISYLESIGIEIDFHLPKPLSSKILRDSVKIFAIDMYILSMLNKTHSKYKHKIFLFKSVSNNYDLSDPYKMNDANYLRIMNNILQTSKELNF